VICLEIMLQIMKRGEFHLENIGFMNEEDRENKLIYERKY
jgi:hypothetical protein